MDGSKVKALDKNLEVLDVCQRILIADIELGQETSLAIKRIIGEIADELAEYEAQRMQEVEGNVRDCE